MRSLHLLLGGAGAAAALGGAWTVVGSARVHIAAGHRNPGNRGAARSVEATEASTPGHCYGPHQRRDGDIDDLMASGIRRRADVADVVLLATQRGPITLFPAVKVQPNAAVAEFDDLHPDGADYVIV